MAHKGKGYGKGYKKPMAKKSSGKTRGMGAATKGGGAAMAKNK